MDNCRYDCLFEPLQIGSATAPSRVYQAPHCSHPERFIPWRSIAFRCDYWSWGCLSTPSKISLVFNQITVFSTVSTGIKSSLLIQMHW